MGVREWWNGLPEDERKAWFVKSYLQRSDYMKSWDELDDICQWSLIVARATQKG